jgi:hypothetical protein
MAQVTAKPIVMIQARLEPAHRWMLFTAPVRVRWAKVEARHNTLT